jgi:hypothetical protein
MADMAPKDLPARVLQEIRDEVRKTNIEVRDLKLAVQATNEKLDATAARLDDRITNLDLRLGTELTTVNANLRVVIDLLRGRPRARH